MPFLHPGDLVRLVSPASRPDPNGTERRAEVLRSWGLRVEVSRHAFDKFSYLAGTDDNRLSDMVDALLDPGVRAVFATRGGKGSYRIAHAVAASSLRHVLMEDGPVVVVTDSNIASAAITTSGSARGPLIGGNLDMIATSAGWALPSLRDAILLIESAGLGIGQFDRALTMLVRAGHLDGIAGVVIGHINGTPPNPPLDAVELLRQHLHGFGVPILGGLPIGHNADAHSVVIGASTEINADRGTLIQHLGQ